MIRLTVWWRLIWYIHLHVVTVLLFWWQPTIIVLLSTVFSLQNFTLMCILRMTFSKFDTNQIQQSNSFLWAKIRFPTPTLPFINICYFFLTFSSTNTSILICCHTIINSNSYFRRCACKIEWINLLTVLVFVGASPQNLSFVSHGFNLINVFMYGIVQVLTYDTWPWYDR